MSANPRPPLLPPLLRLVAAQPSGLSEHAWAYAELVMAESSSAARHWRRRLALLTLAALSAAVCAVLLGVAGMLRATLPDSAPPWLWLLPLLPGVISGWSYWASQVLNPDNDFAELRQQLALDGALLRGGARPAPPPP